MPGTEHFFIISDLHLGGRPPANLNDPHDFGFQMCPQRNQAHLAAFIRWIATIQRGEDTVELIIAGDIVDFLAEEDEQAKYKYAAFTADNGAATAKLKRVIERTSDVWTALRELLKAKAKLTLMIGNHDVELVLPGPRALLRQTLGDERVTYVFDNGSRDVLGVTGGAHVVHGNASDRWNRINHTRLDEIRATLEANEEAYEPPLMTPGSELVVRVMNRIKGEYSFVDLLKPETSAAIPLLVVLYPRVLRELSIIFGLAVGAYLVDRYSPSGPSCDVGAPVGGLSRVRPLFSPDEQEKELEVIRLVQDLLRSAEAADIGAPGDAGSWNTGLSLLDMYKLGWTNERRGYLEDRDLDRLRIALEYFTTDDLSFCVNRESEEYMASARDLAKNDKYKFIILGHTHLAKRVPILPGKIYFNTGTWADIIRLPNTRAKSDEAAREALRDFIGSCEQNQLAAYRTLSPTFVWLQRTGGTNGHLTGDLYRYLGDDRFERVPDDATTVG